MRKTVLAIAVLAMGLGTAALAQEAPGGRRGTGLPVPRYVSLKTDRVNLREGPSKDHRTAWVFQRAGLPVEIVAEYETWRRIRDSEGTEGWVLHSLLSGRRTALVQPWAKGAAPPLTLPASADDKADAVARLQPGVIANVKDLRRDLVPRDDRPRRRPRRERLHPAGEALGRLPERKGRVGHAASSLPQQAAGPRAENVACKARPQ